MPMAPKNLEESAIREVLESLQPAMAVDGGGVELVELDGCNVSLRLIGTCRYCPSRTLTMSRRIEPALLKVSPSAHIRFIGD